MQTIIDERANPEQRKALAAVMQGEDSDPGTIMLQIYRSMCSTYHEPHFAPIELEVDLEARTARLSIPGLVETVIEPIKNPVTGAPHRARFDLRWARSSSRPRWRAVPPRPLALCRFASTPSTPIWPTT